MKQYLFGLMMAAIGLSSVCYAECDDCCQSLCCTKGPFEGFYLGTNMGWASDQTHRFGLSYFQETGFVGGVQFGHNWQCDDVVYGFVLDFDGATNNYRVGVGEDSFSKLRSSMNWFTMIRGRVGWAPCNTLVYLTAGAIGANIRAKLKLGETVLAENRGVVWGWVGGVGLERKICGNWSAATELTYATIDTTASSSKRGLLWGNSDNIWAARVMVNYRIDDLCCPW